MRTTYRYYIWTPAWLCVWACSAYLCVVGCFDLLGMCKQRSWNTPQCSMDKFLLLNMVMWWCCTSDARLTKHSIGEEEFVLTATANVWLITVYWRLQGECPNLCAPGCTQWSLHSSVHHWPSLWACVQSGQLQLRLSSYSDTCVCMANVQ